MATERIRLFNFKFPQRKGHDRRRVEKEVISVSTTITRYVYDNEDILLEVDGSNNIVARYTHGPGIDEPLIMEKGGASFFYHADGLGSITELTNQSGTIVQRYTYSSFGKVESQLDPNFVQPYTFTSREFDPESDLYHYRKRTYDWRTGKFSQVDPIGFAGGDVNLYSYVGNNPTNRVDPLGLQPCPSGTQQQFSPSKYALCLGTRLAFKPFIPVGCAVGVVLCLKGNVPGCGLALASCAIVAIDIMDCYEAATECVPVLKRPDDPNKFARLLCLRTPPSA